MFTRVERLKRQARKHYIAYYAELDTLDCGRAMGEVVSHRMSTAKQEFNRVMDKLAQLDPACPKTRL